MKARIIHSLSPASERNLAAYMARRKRRKHGLRGVRDRVRVWLRSVRRWLRGEGE
jgi:hypothetical protein